LVEAFKGYKESKNKTSEKLDKLTEAVSRIEQSLEHTPSKDDVLRLIREEISYAERFKRE